MTAEIKIVRSITSRYDGENLKGNGIEIEFGGQRFVYQYFDTGMRLTTLDGGWWLAYESDPLIVWRYEGTYPEGGEVRRAATEAEIEIAKMAKSGELSAFVRAQPSDAIVDRTPWQKGDDQAE